MVRLGPSLSLICYDLLFGGTQYSLSPKILSRILCSVNFDLVPHQAYSIPSFSPFSTSTFLSFTVSPSEIQTDLINRGVQTNPFDLLWRFFCLLFGFGNTDLAFRKTSPLHSPSQKRKYSLTARPFAVPNPSAKTARGRRRWRSTAPSQQEGPRPVQKEQLPKTTFPIKRRQEGVDQGDHSVSVEADVVE